MALTPWWPRTLPRTTRGTSGAMLWIWLGFVCFILLLLALDLGVFHRKAHVIRIREALAWSAVWVGLGLCFAVFVYFGYEHHWLGLGAAVDAVDGQVNDGRSATLKYLTGYVIEKSLSVDNIFVIAVLFRFFAVPAVQQHRVLFWGIIGALAMRGAMIALGSRLIAEFHWVLYVFGGFLILTAAKMLLIGDGHASPADNPVLRAARKLLPVTDTFHGEHFLVRVAPPLRAGPNGAGESHNADTRRGTLMLTPLALALIMIETTDLLFAVDSIPAIFAITADPFLVFTSNVFAILGLRSLYFALAGVLDKFRYLRAALAATLAVVGGKMLAASWLKQVVGENFSLYLLAVILLILATGVIASVVADRRERGAGPPDHPRGRRPRVPPSDDATPSRLPGRFISHVHSKEES